MFSMSDIIIRLNSISFINYNCREDTCCTKIREQISILYIGKTRGFYAERSGCFPGIHLFPTGTMNGKDPGIACII